MLRKSEKSAISGYFRHFRPEKNFLKNRASSHLGITSLHLCAKNQKKLNERTRTNERKCKIMDKGKQRQTYLSRRSQTSIFPSAFPMKKTEGRDGLHIPLVNLQSCGYD